MKHVSKTTAILSAVAAILICSCTKQQEPDIIADNVVLNLLSLDLTVGQTASLTASVRPENATDRTIRWSSTKESVAVVDAGGKVTALSRGHAYIVALNPASGLKASCLVSVTSARAYTITVTTEDGTEVEEGIHTYPGMSLKLNVTSDDDLVHQYGWDVSGEVTVEEGILGTGIGTFVPAEGYLHYLPQDIKVVSEDGFFKKFTVVNNISSEFLFGNTGYDAGTGLSAGDGRNTKMALLWDDGNGNLLEVPAAKYTLESSDESLVSFARQDGNWMMSSVAGRNGEVNVYVIIGEARTGLCSVSVAINPDYNGSIDNFPYEEY